MHKLVFLFFASIMSLSAQSQVPIGDIDFKRLDGFKKPDARKEIKIPNILGYTTLKADFHIHTIFQMVPFCLPNVLMRLGVKD